MIDAAQSGRLDANIRDAMTAQPIEQRRRLSRVFQDQSIPVATAQRQSRQSEESVQRLFLVLGPDCIDKSSMDQTGPAQLLHRLQVHKSSALQDADAVAYLFD